MVKLMTFVVITLALIVIAIVLVQAWGLISHLLRLIKKKNYKAKRLKR